jgi:hypothetical protein
MEAAGVNLLFYVERRAFTDDHQADIRGLPGRDAAFSCVRPELPLSSNADLSDARTAYRKRGFSYRSSPFDIEDWCLS